MKVVAITFMAFLSLSAAQVAAAEYCETDEFDGKTSCSFQIDSGGVMDPKVLFAAEIEGSEPKWQMLLYFVFEDWHRLDGDARVKIDDGEILTLKHIGTNRDVVSGDTVTEAAIYWVSTEALTKMANAQSEIWFRVPANDAPAEDLKVPASKFSELTHVINEARAVQ